MCDHVPRGTRQLEVLDMSCAAQLLTSFLWITDPCFSYPWHPWCAKGTVRWNHIVSMPSGVGSSIAVSCNFWNFSFFLLLFL
jgi:hypothetical protein